MSEEEQKERKKRIAISPKSEKEMPWYLKKLA